MFPMKNLARKGLGMGFRGIFYTATAHRARIEYKDVVLYLPV